MDKICQQLARGTSVSLATIVATWQAHFPLLAQLRNTPQDPLWHGEGDVGIHTARVMEEVLSQPSSSMDVESLEQLSLVLGAVFHDIGKPLATLTREINGQPRIVSPHHAERGRSYLALRLPLLGLPPEAEAHVMALTGYHHQPRRLVQDVPCDAAWRRLARLCSTKLVYWLEQADLRGRICQDLEEQLACIEIFRMECEERDLWGNNDPWKEWREAIDSAFPSRSEGFRRHAYHAAVRDAEAGTIVSVEEGIARAWQLRDPIAELTLLCGPSGSGKSEWIARYADGVAVLSLDDLREEIAGKRADQSMNGQVMQAAKERLKGFLRQGKSVIWDATNLRRDGRSWVTQLGMDYGAHVRIIALQATVPTLLSRNRKREHSIPNSVLERQIESMEWPTADEAHELVVVKSE